MGRGEAYTGFLWGNLRERDHLGGSGVDGRIILRCVFAQYCSGDKIQMGEACSTYGERRGVCGVLMGKPEGKRKLGRPRSRWEDNIKMDLWEVRFGCIDWIKLAQDRDRWRALVNAVMNLRVP
jgi:hypothetical protein